MRAQIVLPIMLVLAALVLGGCRCDTPMPEQNRPPQRQAPVTPPAQGDGPMVWCMACAKAGFTACKRVEGRDGEENVKRRAELAACEDVGIPEDRCTGDVLNNVKCGTMP